VVDIGWLLSPGPAGSGRALGRGGWAGQRG